jgi:uncharacterized membrane protein
MHGGNTVKKSNQRNAAVLAVAAAALFAIAPVSTVSAGEMAGHCAGVNACKGHGSCKGANNACAGHNACKGQGFVGVDETTCGKLGGKYSAG